MSDRMVAFTFSFTGQAALDKAQGFIAPVGMTIVGMTVRVGALTGSPTNVKFDLMGGSAGTTELLADVFTVTAAGSAEWLTPTFGGTQTPFAVADGDQISVDVKFTGGSTPTVTGSFTIFALLGTK